MTYGTFIEKRRFFCIITICIIPFVPDFKNRAKNRGAKNNEFCQKFAPEMAWIEIPNSRQKSRDKHLRNRAKNRAGLKKCVYKTT